MTDLLTLIDRAMAAGEDVYSLATAAASEAVENMDERRFLIGDLASRLEKAYATDVTGKFAKDIGEDVGRVREYKTTCSFWTNSARAEFSGEPLHYSHYRATARKGLEGNREQARELMWQAVKDEMSAEKLRLKATEAIRKLKGNDAPLTFKKKIADTAGCVVDMQTRADGWTIITLAVETVSAELVEAHRAGKPIHVTMTAEYTEAEKQ